MTPKDAAHMIDETMKRTADVADRLSRSGDDRGAKDAISDAQRSLRDLKRDVNEIQRQIREAGTDARLSANSSGQLIGMFAGSKARGNMSRVRAAQKRGIARRQADALQPWNVVKAEIDKALARLTQAKAYIGRLPGDADDDVAASPSPTASTPAPPPPTVVQTVPPAWAEDPFGRHELRWWDGSKWTEHVSDRGQTGTDPATY